MSAFHIDSATVLAASQRVAGIAARLSEDSVHLLTELTGLESSWSGQAALAFQSTVAQWRHTSQVVEQSLMSIQQALTHAANSYAEVEAANARMFQGQ